MLTLSWFKFWCSLKPTCLLFSMFYNAILQAVKLSVASHHIMYPNVRVDVHVIRQRRKLFRNSYFIMNILPVWCCNQWWRLVVSKKDKKPFSFYLFTFKLKKRNCFLDNTSLSRLRCKNQLINA